MSDVKVYIDAGNEIHGAVVETNPYIVNISREYARIFSYDDYISSSGVAEPTAQPTSLTFTSVTSTSYTVSFTASVGGADGYLAIRRTGASPTGTPVDGTTYSIGDTLGDGTVRHFGSAVTFNESGLTSSTAYYYDVFAWNGDVGTYKYLTTSPLEGSQSTAFDFLNAIQFDGTNDRVTHTVAPFLGGRSTFTFACWVKFDTNTGFQTLFSERGSGNKQCELYYNWSITSWIFNSQNGSNINIVVSDAISINTWYHVGVTYSAGTVVFYRDGSVKSQTGSAAAAVGATGVSIVYGARPDGSNFLNGYMDEMAFWSDALASHITNIYNSGNGATPGASNLIKYNACNDTGTSTVLTDDTATDNGTLVNFNFDTNDGWKTH